LDSSAFGRQVATARVARTNDSADDRRVIADKRAQRAIKRRASRRRVSEALPQAAKACRQGA